MDLVGLVEGGAQHRCIGDFTAMAAGHAVFVHMGHGVWLEGVAAGSQGETGTA